MAQAIRTFRIFVSSTFSDLKEERNALQRHVFPRLRQLCLESGTRFQAIDLRWGVREEAGLDQRTMQICLDEIERCRRASPRPNFIVLLGDRYGWRPLPAQIPEEEFERIRQSVAAGPDAELLAEWYLRDDNAKPPEYCLKPRRVAIDEHQTKEEQDAMRRAEADRWRQIERSLRRIVTDAARAASLTAAETVKYETSATEQEIRSGAMKVDDAAEHVFCFFREITNLDDLVRDLPDDLPEEDRAKNFIDTAARDAPDSDASRYLRGLKQELTERLPHNIHRYQTGWRGRRGTRSEEVDARSGGVMQALDRTLRVARTEAATLQLDDQAWERLRQVRDEELRRTPAASGSPPDATDPRPSVIALDHLPALCADVFLELARVILLEIARLEERDPLEKEIADHEDFSRDRARFFIGRAQILQTIAGYAPRADGRPLAVHGASGSGKSAVIARAAALVGEEHPRAEIVRRFIGATPGSSDIRTLLESLCRQISRAYGADEATVPTDYKELAQEFPKRLALATADRPLVVFLDALDQLSDADHARNLIWLPAALPAHTALVVSTTTGECLAALERKLPAGGTVEVKPMPPDEARELLELWLTSAGRTLQEHQRDEVLEKFEQSRPPETEDTEPGGLPLYLKLAFEEARRWKSYSEHPPLSADVPGIIRDLFARLSLDGNHGALMVSRSLAYLAASRNGLSEDEVLDVLTLDDEVLTDFEERARHVPPERRLPVVVWSRLYFDLEPYLTERAADGASLLAFYHRQLREVVEQDYLGKAKPARHAVLAKYFGKRDLFEKEGQVPNVRKLSELPYQQTYAELWEELYKTLTDFDFLEAKCTHVAVVTQGRGETARTVYGGVYELQEDYRRALEVFPNA